MGDFTIEERAEVNKLLPEMATHPNIIFQHNG